VKKNYFHLILLHQWILVHGDRTAASTSLTAGHAARTPGRVTLPPSLNIYHHLVHILKDDKYLGTDVIVR
jgi:hypothetical protein